MPPSTSLDRQVAELAATPPAQPATATATAGYQPPAAPRFWKLDGAAREEAIAKLRAWVEQVYRPGYGHLAASLGDCWDQHPLCLYILDWLSELWSVLYLRPARTPGTLAGQAEWHTRLLTAAAEQLARETRRCGHATSRSRTAPSRERGHDRPATTAQRSRRSPTRGTAGRCSPASPAARNPPPGTASTTPPPTRTRSPGGGSATPAPTWPSPPARPGPDVLDVDQHGPAGNGFAAFNQLNRAGLTDGASAIVATPSGGLHAYFTGSDQHSGKLPRHHLDFRAQGGYVLAPPSHVGGKPYRLIRHQRRVRRPGLGQGHRPARTRAPRRPQPARRSPRRPEPPRRLGRPAAPKPQPQRRPVLGRLPGRRGRRRAVLADLAAAARPPASPNARSPRRSPRPGAPPAA